MSLLKTVLLEAKALFKRLATDALQVVAGESLLYSSKWRIANARTEF
jgi:hypothetical protein